MTFMRAIVACAAIGIFAPIQGQPPKPAATGTAVVSGTVVSSAAPAQPVRRAIVKLSGRGELSRSAVTGDDGRFAIGFLPGGTYTLTVSKPAYLTTRFGEMGPGQPGTPFVIKDGETIANLRVPITKGAAIAGTVRDQSGEGAEGVTVFAVRVELTKGRQTDSLALETATTDDNGAYRIFGLAPGAYIVGAMPKVSTSGGVFAPTPEQIDKGEPATAERVGYAPTYHPSAISPAQAGTLIVEAGDDRRADISLRFVPIAMIEGEVLGADGRPAPDVSLNLSRIGPPLPGASSLLPLAPLPMPNGTFRYANVPPGSWTITARVTSRVVVRNADGSLVSSSGNANELPPGPYYWAATTVEANGGTPHVTLRLRQGLTMTGRVVFDSAGTAIGVSPSQVRLTMAQDPDPARAATALFPLSPPANGSPAANGTFELRGLTPGPWLLNAIVPGAAGPDGWWLRSAIMDGRDLLDSPLDVGDRDLTGVEITLSNRHTELSGSLTNGDGKPASALVIVVMPADRRLWTSTRRVQQTRPATDGHFSFSDLPAGEYLLAAVTNLPAEAWRTEAFLGGVAPAGVKVAIGEGEKKVQGLRVGG